MSTIESEPLKAKRLLAARGISSYALDAKVLLADALGKTREYKTD